MEQYRHKNILVTGGLGFIGSNLARRLVRFGANVTLVDSLNPVYGGNIFNVHDIRDEVTINVGDVRDAHALTHFVKGQDYLFNLAGQTSHLDSMEDPETDLAINAGAQLSILEVCRKVNPTIKIVFAGTRQVYGRPQYLPVDEKHPAIPPIKYDPDYFLELIAFFVWVRFRELVRVRTARLNNAAILI